MMLEKEHAGEKAYREEIVHFYDGETELAGILCLPEGAGPHPVVIFIHGSGPADREGFGGFPPLWQAFARRGCASLAWDKPGVGASSGDWRLQTPQERARECLAALTYLARREDIDAGNMGVYGRSQAGWVIPYLVQMTDLVACVVAVSVSVASGSEQDVYRVAHQLPADGFTPEEVERAVAFARLRAALIHLRAPYACLADLQTLAAQEPWFEDAGGAYAEADYQVETSAPERYARPILSSITCPVLAVFGERDTLIDIQESVEAYTELRRAGNRDVTIKVFASADHGPFLTRTGGMKEMQHSLQQAERPFPPGYLDLLADWLQRHLAPARNSG